MTGHISCEIISQVNCHICERGAFHGNGEYVLVLRRKQMYCEFKLFFRIRFFFSRIGERLNRTKIAFLSQNAEFSAGVLSVPVYLREERGRNRIS